MQYHFNQDLACFVNLRIRETENANRLERLQKSIDNQIPEEMERMGHLHVSYIFKQDFYFTFTCESSFSSEISHFCLRIWSIKIYSNFVRGNSVSN